LYEVFSLVVAPNIIGHVPVINDISFLLKLQSFLNQILIIVNSLEAIHQSVIEEYVDSKEENGLDEHRHQIWEDLTKLALPCLIIKINNSENGSAERCNRNGIIDEITQAFIIKQIDN